MVKARKEEDGNIKIYGTLPSKFRGKTGNYAGGFHLMDEDIIKEEGFYDLVIPEYSRFTEMLGQIYFDEQEEVFTYEVSPKPDLPSIEEAKINKIDELKKLAKNKFNETDWYYIREFHYQKIKKEKEKGQKLVPEEVVQEREWVYAVVDYKEAEINLLPDLESVLAYEVNLEIDMAEIEKPIEEVLSEEILPEEILPEEIVEEGTEEVLTDLPTEEGVENTPAETQEETQAETLTETSEETSEETQAETPEEKPEETQAETPEENPEETQAETQTETPTEIPIETSAETPTEETPTEEKVIDIEAIKKEINENQTSDLSEGESSAEEEDKDTPLETITETISDVISKIKEPVTLAIAKRKNKRATNKITKYKTKNKIAKISTRTKKNSKDISRKISSKTKKSRA